MRLEGVERQRRVVERERERWRGKEDEARKWVCKEARRGRSRDSVFAATRATKGQKGRQTKGWAVGTKAGIHSGIARGKVLANVKRNENVNCCPFLNLQ